MVYMLQIGMIVKILPDAEYSGKFTGYIGKVKNYFSQNKKVGVELFQQTNDASSKGLFWFSESKVVAAGTLPDAMMEYIKADLNATFGVANHTRRSRQIGLPQIKKVIYSGPKPFPRLSFPGRSQNAVASQRFPSGSETGKPVYL